MKKNYSAIAAKLKAASAGRLTRADYGELLSKSTVNEIYSYLLTTGYRDVLSELSGKQIHRTEIEKALRHEMIREYGRVYSFMDIDGQRVLEFWFMQREIEFLKRGLRHLYNKESNDWVEGEDEFEEFFEKHTEIDCGLVKNASTLDKLIEACADTPYAGVLKRSQTLGADYFMMAMMLDRYYYTSAWRAKEKYLSGKDKKLFEEIFGMEIDINNIIWIYRSKKYFDLSPDVIAAWILPVHHRLSTQTLIQLAQGSWEDVIKITKGTVYKELFDGIDEGYFPEENERRIYCGKARRIFRQNPESLAAVFAYFDLKEIEIFNITTVIESIRYGRDKQTIMRHLNIGEEE